MKGSLHLREVSKSDLPDVLRLYAQPDLDDGKILSLSDAERILKRMARYPNYKVYVAVSDTRVVVRRISLRHPPHVVNITKCEISRQSHSRRYLLHYWADLKNL